MNGYLCSDIKSPEEEEEEEGQTVSSKSSDIVDDATTPEGYQQQSFKSSNRDIYFLIPIPIPTFTYKNKCESNVGASIHA